MCIVTHKVMLFATGLLLKISAQKRKAGEEGVNGLETSKFINYTVYWAQKYRFFMTFNYYIELILLNNFKPYWLRFILIEIISRDPRLTDEML